MPTENQRVKKCSTPAWMGRVRSNVASTGGALFSAKPRPPPNSNRVEAFLKGANSTMNSGRRCQDASMPFGDVYAKLKSGAMARLSVSHAFSATAPEVPSSSTFGKTPTPNPRAPFRPGAASLVAAGFAAAAPGGAGRVSAAGTTATAAGTVLFPGAAAPPGPTGAGCIWVPRPCATALPENRRLTKISRRGSRNTRRLMVTPHVSRRSRRRASRAEDADATEQGLPGQLQTQLGDGQAPDAPQAGAPPTPGHAPAVLRVVSFRVRHQAQPG